MADSEGGEGTLTGRLPYQAKVSRSVEGRKVEAKVLKARGYQIHSNSGAGHIKEDGHDEYDLVEHKLTAKSFTLNGKDLLTTHIRANRQERVACWLVTFSDYDITAEIRITANKRKERK